MSAVDAPARIAHYKKLGISKAWCGTVPMLSFDDWNRVTCDECLDLAEKVHERLPRVRKSEGLGSES